MIQAMYVHVPFCNAICAYCDFTRCKYHKPLVDLWLHRIIQDINDIPKCDLQTLYIGGGTPSSLHTEQLYSLLQALAPFTQKVKEFTIEANADSLDDDKIACMKKFHVNRISLGAQSFQPELLRIIERDAGYEMIAQRITTLYEFGIDNISIDLMYGLPTQTLAMWKDDLAKAITLPINHISLYSLTIEEHSKFGRMAVAPCDEELESDMFEFAISFLQEHGFNHYETSNFAREDKASLHNQMYWHYEDFYGIGCGASGKQDHQRYDNTVNLHTYITQGASPVITSLSKQDEMFEMVMMNLRLCEGIQEDTFFQRFHQTLNDTYKDIIEQQIALGNLQRKQGCVKTTYQGMMTLNEVLLNFL